MLSASTVASIIIIIAVVDNIDILKLLLLVFSSDSFGFDSSIYTPEQLHFPAACSLAIPSTDTVRPKWIMGVVVFFLMFLGGEFFPLHRLFEPVTGTARVLEAIFEVSLSFLLKNRNFLRTFQKPFRRKLFNVTSCNSCYNSANSKSWKLWFSYCTINGIAGNTSLWITITLTNNNAENNNVHNRVGLWILG